jgi:hypothetical protein
MTRERLLQQAQSLLASLRREIEVARNMGKGDLFEIAEDVVCPVLRVAYDLPGLENLNVTKHVNYPSIDLGDRDSREAFQITSRVTTSKIESTLDTFFEHGLHSHYSRLRFLGLYKTQKSYPQERIEEHIRTSFDFDANRDVIDLGDVERHIAGIETPKLSQVVQVLSDELAGDYVVSPRISEKQSSEYLISNLIEIDVPNFVYTAEIAIDRDELIETTWEDEDVRELNKRASWTQVIKAALILDGEPPVNDFLVHGGEFITFHNLNDASERLSDYVFRESVRKVRSEEFFEESDDRHRLFVYLLGRCFSQVVHYLGIKYHYDEGQYFYLPREDELEPRKEQWTSIDESRTVYKPTLDEERELWYAKHLSFETRFFHLQDAWHLAVTPDWYWSFDGAFRTYSKIGDRRDWIKNNEWNGQVKNHFRFLKEYLAREINQIRSQFRNTYAYLSLVDGVVVGPTPKLDDQLWTSRVERMKDGSDDEVTLFNQ